MDARLDRLAELLPPPPAAPPTDWARVEPAMGTALPVDFKRFCDRWGNGGEIEGEHRGPVNVWATPRDAREWHKSFRTMVREMDRDVPLHPEPGGLLVWGGSESESTLLWDTTGSPDDWTVVVWEDVALGDPVPTGLPFVAWLVAALEGRLPTERLPAELWPEDGAPPRPEWFPRDES